MYDWWTSLKHIREQYQQEIWLWFSVLYKLLLFLGDSILLGRFKLGNEIIDMSGVVANFSRYRSDRYFILDDCHELWVDIMSRHIKLIFWECWDGLRKDLGKSLQYLYLGCCGGGRKAALTVQTFLEVTEKCRWGDEVYNQRYLSDVCDRLLYWWDLCFTLLSCLPLCMKL